MALFPSSSLLWPAATEADLEKPLPVLPPNLCQSAAARAWPFAFKTFDYLLELSLGEIARRLVGARTWTQTQTLLSDQRVVEIISALNSLDKVCGV